MNDKIERKAVSAVSEMVDRNPYLTPYILHNDKDPSWDGFINRNSKTDRNKSSFSGRVPVQVKGTLRDKLSVKYSKYSLSVDDLNSYKVDGGCILFLVEITRNFMEYRIFYRLLLPAEIDIVIPKKKKQKSVSIKLEYIDHDDSGEIKKLIDKFLFHQPKQLNTRVSLPKNFENFDTKFTLFANKQTFEQTLLSEPIYLYTKLNDVEGDIFFSRVIIDYLDTHIEKNISVNKIVYFRSYIIRRTLEDRKVIIGKSFEISDSKTKLSLEGSLYERINLMKFLIHADSIGCYNIDGNSVNFSLEEHKEYFLQLLKEHQNFVDLLSFFGIKQDIKMVDITEKQLRMLKVLIDNVLYGKKISGITNGNGFLNFKIDNIDILFYLLKVKNDIKIIDIFNYNDRRYIVTSQKNTEITEYPLILFANHKDLISAVNTNFTGLLDAIESYRVTESFIAQINSFVLELIHSYDKSKRLIFIDIAYDIILFAETHSLESYILINKMQIRSRKNMMSNDDKKIIRNIVEQSDDIAVKLGGSILLNNLGNIEMYQELMSNKEFNNFKKYPIYSLYTKLLTQ